MIFLDADDKLLPNCLEAGVACFTERPEAAMVFGRYQVIGQDGGRAGQVSKLYEGEDLYRGLLSSNCISMVAAVMFRREIFDKVGCFKPELSCAEDYDLYLRIANKFPSNRHHKIVAEYRVYGSSASNDLALMLRGVSITLKSQRKNVEGNKEYEDAHRAGLKFWREYYGESLYLRTARRIWDIKHSSRTIRDLWYLIRYYPQVITIHSASRLNKLRDRFLNKLRFDL